MLCGTQSISDHPNRSRSPFISEYEYNLNDFQSARYSKNNLVIVNLEDHISFHKNSREK